MTTLRVLSSFLPARHPIIIILTSLIRPFGKLPCIIKVFAQISATTRRLNAFE